MKKDLELTVDSLVELIETIFDKHIKIDSNDEVKKNVYYLKNKFNLFELDIRTELKKLQSPLFFIHIMQILNKSVFIYNDEDCNFHILGKETFLYEIYKFTEKIYKNQKIF